MRNTLKKISEYVPSPWGRAWVGVLFLLLPFTFNAQTNIFPASGNVGIGTTNPNYKLTVDGTISNNSFRMSYEHGDLWMRRYGSGDLTWKRALSTLGSMLRINFSGDYEGGVNIQGPGLLVDGNVGIGTTAPNAKLHINSSENGAIQIHREGYPDKYLDIWHGTSGAVIDAINTTTGLLYLGYANPVNVYLAKAGGSVGIGTTNINGWKLAVNGNIRAKEIKVETGWSDFVFEDSYNLPTLEEVEQHIKEKGHLKDIPSAKEVEANGIFLGEMDAKLLQKIEELTLYTIQLQKEVNALSAENQQFRKEIDELKKP
ncbi:hypothetical protein [Sinomicrobium sp. M5D2P17]